MKSDGKKEAIKLLKEWKGDSYLFGQNVLDKIGEVSREFGENTLLICSCSDWVKKSLTTLTESLEKNNVYYHILLGARPNCPREDLYRLALQVAIYEPDSIIAFGGGSTIDCVKAATVLANFTSSEVSGVLGIDWDKADSIDPYFGTSIVTRMREATKRDLLPVIAIQTASSSGAHLTKYANITNPLVGQKKLIVDDAIIPKRAIFDYGVTIGAPKSLTLDGGLDGIAHLWEVFMGATGKDYYEKAKQIASIGISLIVNNLKLALKDNVDARTALGLGTDLGGYSIMIGGTNGPHLGSFSLVDILSHGRSCAILNPYYTVFFSPNIQDQLRTIGKIFKKASLIEEDLNSLEGRELGVAVAKGMINFNKSLGFPTTLKEAGATKDHIDRMLEAAKDPQLNMKLQNMPVPLAPEKGDIEVFMKGVLESAFTGDFELIKVKF